MAYTKTTWATGDVITADKLNNAEEGIEAAQPFVVHVTYDEEAQKSIMDKTYAEIRTALMSGKYISVVSNAIPELQLPEDLMGSVVFARPSDGRFDVITTEGLVQLQDEGNTVFEAGFFTAVSEDGYPERSLVDE